MRKPHECSFDEWRTMYFSFPGPCAEREEVLDNMRLTARWKEDWSELFHIATEEEGLSPGHPFAAICSNGIGFAPSANDVPKIFPKSSLLGMLCDVLLGPAGKGRVRNDPVTHR